MGSRMPPTLAYIYQVKNVDCCNVVKTKKMYANEALHGTESKKKK